MFEALHRCWLTIADWIKCWIPPEIRNTVDERRSKLLIAFSALTLLTSPLWPTVQILQGHPDLAFVAGITCLLFTIPPLLLYRWKSIQLAANSFVGLATIAVLGFVIISGGIYSDLIIYLPILPLLALAMSGAISGLATGLFLATFMAALVVCESFNIELPIIYTETTNPLVIWINIMLILTYCTSLMQFYERSYTSTLARLRNANKQLAENNEQLAFARESAEQAQQDAEAADIAKSRFLANMSHELRTPINGLLGMIQLLEDTTLNTEQMDQLNTMTTCSELLLTIINDILDLSKIQAGKCILESIPTDLHACTHEVIQMLRARAQDKGLQLSSNIRDDVPQYIVSDPVRLKQILVNLVGNAIKFTSAGSVTVEISADTSAGTSESEKSEEKCMLHIAVRDTGIGIPKDRLNTIFDIFAQADAGITRQHGGTGLGLTISRELTDLLGGNISVSSQLGQGSTFCVNLPATISQTQALTKPLFPTPSQQHTLRVLVAEDNEINRRVIQGLLRSMGHEVALASDGIEAIEVWQTSLRFDIILMDCQMPRCDGLTATRRIRSLPQGDQIPIIALTAHVLEEMKTACTDAGMNGYLGKPIRKADLAQTLQDFADKSTHGDQLKTGSN